MRTTISTLTTFVLVASLSGCKSEGSKQADAEPEQDQAAAAAEQPAEDDAEAEAEAEGEDAPNWAERTKKLEEQYAEKAKDWTQEDREAAKKIVDTAFEDLEAALTAVLAAPFREPKNVERDEYRHPKETLEFFGLEPDMKVLEIAPGGGWYTEVLAPVLAKEGKLVHVSYDAESEDPEVQYFAKRASLLLESKPELYGAIDTVENQTTDDMNLGEPGTYDMVTVIRMLHNFKRSDKLEPMLEAVHEVLEPDGVLAVVQHRAKPDADPAESAQKGRLPEQWVIDTIESKGFRLEAKSDINANPKDTKDYEKGVWTLPPTLTLGDEDKQKYQAIGESDRMTLKFVRVEQDKEEAQGPEKAAAEDDKAE